MMVEFKILFFVAISVFYFATAEKNNTSEELNLTSSETESVLSFFQAMIQYGYEEDKLDVISRITKELSQNDETSNITLIGTQNIYDTDGSIKEIRTVELSMPKITSKSSISIKLSNEDDDALQLDDIDNLKELIELFQAASMLGLPMEMSYRQQDKNGITDEAMYLSKNILFARSQGLNFLNETIEVPNKRVVDEKIKELQNTDTNLPTAILAYDAQGNFLKNESVIVAELMSTITDDYNEPDVDTIETALRGLSQVALESKSRDEIPRGLVTYLENNFSNISFHVVADQPSGSYISKDFSMSLTYDFGDLDESLSYTVYGFKKESS